MGDAPGTRFGGVAFSRDGRPGRRRGGRAVAEIRDARSNSAVRVIEDFPPCSMTAVTPAGVLGGGAGGGWARKQAEPKAGAAVPAVGLRRADDADGAGKRAHTAMSPDGTKLAVGMAPDGVAIYSSHNSWADAPLCLGGSTAGVASTAFSHDGRFLCTGSHPAGIFSIWDVEAAVCIRAIRTGDWHACAFSPADDLLATGGDQGHPVRLHELSPPPPPGRFAMPGEAKLPISAAAASEAVVVLASGKRLVALARCDGRVLWQTDLEEAAMVVWMPRWPQPTGEQVVLHPQVNIVSVLGPRAARSVPAREPE